MKIFIISLVLFICGCSTTLIDVQKTNNIPLQPNAIVFNNNTQFKIVKTANVHANTNKTQVVFVTHINDFNVSPLFVISKYHYTTNDMLNIGYLKYNGKITASNCYTNHCSDKLIRLYTELGIYKERTNDE